MIIYWFINPSTDRVFLSTDEPNNSFYSHAQWITEKGFLRGGKYKYDDFPRGELRITSKEVQLISRGSNLFDPESVYKKLFEKYPFLKDSSKKYKKNMSLPKYLPNAKYKGTLLRGSARFLDDKDKYEVGDILKNFKTSSAAPPKTIEITKKELQEPGAFLPDQAFYYYKVVTRNNSMPNPPHLKRRSNSAIAENARKMAEKFHGRKVERVITVDEIEKDVSDLAVIGELEQLQIFPIGSDTTQIDLNFEDQLDNEKTVIEVCTDSEGKQIYLEKGNQNIDKGLSKIKSETSQTLAQRFIVLGHILAICYFTDKWHLEEENEPLWRVYSISKSGKRTLEGEDLFEEDAIELQRELEGSGDEIQIGTPYRHEFGEDGGEMPFLIYDELNKKLSIVGGTYIVKDVGIWN